jgi:hypothetical protein
MTIQEIDAQITQLKVRRAALVAEHETERAAQRAAERRALHEWVTTDAHGLARRSLSLDECRRYAVVNGTKLKAVLFAAQCAEVPIVQGETIETEGETVNVPAKWLSRQTMRRLSRVRPRSANRIERGMGRGI